MEGGGGGLWIERKGRANKSSDNASTLAIAEIQIGTFSLFSRLELGSCFGSDGACIPMAPPPRETGRNRGCGSKKEPATQDECEGPDGGGETTTRRPGSTFNCDGQRKAKEKIAQDVFGARSNR